MKGLFKEKIEFYKANFKTAEGIFEYLIGSFIWGYIFVNYNEKIYNYILNLLTFTDNWFKIYLSYLIFGLVFVPIGIAITFVITSIYHIWRK